MSTYQHQQIKRNTMKRVTKNRNADLVQVLTSIGLNPHEIKSFLDEIINREKALADLFTYTIPNLETGKKFIELLGQGKPEYNLNEWSFRDISILFEYNHIDPNDLKLFLEWALSQEHDLVDYKNHSSNELEYLKQQSRISQVQVLIECLNWPA